MTELVLVAIALMCQINSGSMWTSGAIEDAQKRCHAYYADCIGNGRTAIECIKERK